jgi:Ca-activated chloride channel family protein
MLLLALAALEPKIGQSPVQETGLHDLYVLMDVSGSMQATDLAPSRMEAARHLVLDLAQALPGERLGLLAYTDFAQVLCPLTHDHETWRLYLQMLDPRQFGNQGTQLRPVLTLAWQRFQADSLWARPMRLGGLNPPNLGRSRHLVLLTDGYDHGLDYGSVVQRLRQEGVHAHIVAVGTPAGGPLPAEVLAAAGPLAPATVTVQIDSLRRLATAMDAHMYQLEVPEQRIGLAQDIANRIRQSPPGASLAESDAAAAGLAPWLLIPAFGCLFASILLLPRRRRPGEQDDLPSYFQL